MADKGERMITVCSACRQASCWQARFMCDEADTAGTLSLPESLLRAEGREHPDYMLTDDELTSGVLPGRQSRGEASDG